MLNITVKCKKEVPPLIEILVIDDKYIVLFVIKRKVFRLILSKWFMYNELASES